MKWGLVLSFFLHLLMVSLLILGQMFPSASNVPHQKGGASTNSVAVRTLSPEQLKKEISRALAVTKRQNQIVQADNKAVVPLGEVPEHAFLSKSNNKVDHETRAARVGEFKNVFNPGTRKKPTTEDLLKLTRNPRDLEPEQALVAKTGRLRAPASESVSSDQTGDGESQTDDHLKDIAVGSETLLNTKEFIFYSFYERIRKSLRQTWNLRIEAELNRLLSLGVPLQQTLSTEVHVTLSATGQIVRVDILKSSGVEELDRAARLAFFDAAPFPNPPRGMITNSNDISLRWDFVIVNEPTGPVRVDVRRAYN
jgi:TonB family protein